MTRIFVSPCHFCQFAIVLLSSHIIYNICVCCISYNVRQEFIPLYIADLRKYFFCVDKGIFLLRKRSFSIALQRRLQWFRPMN